MAIRDTSKKPFIQDRDEEVFIGIDLPFRKSDGVEGWFASTSTTIEAVKNNIRNLLNTEVGERLMQPGIGISLKKYLFSQVDSEIIMTIQNEILDTFEFWLPFVTVNDIQIFQKNTTEIGVNSIFINIIFNINRDPNTLDSVQIAITNTGEQTDPITTVDGQIGTGGY